MNFRPSKPWPVCRTLQLYPILPPKKPSQSPSPALFNYSSTFLRACPALPRKTHYVSDGIFSYSLGVCVISLNIQTELLLKDPSCLCGVMAAIGPKSRILRCCPLPPGVFSLFFGFRTHSAVCWRTCTLSYCRLANLCFHLASWWCICVCLLKLWQT